MTCALCGSDVAPDAQICHACGAAASLPAPAAASPSSDKVLAVTQLCLKLTRLVFVDPMQGLPAAACVLAKREALEVGLVLAVLFDLCATLALALRLPGDSSADSVLKLLIASAVPPVAITAGGYLARKVFRSPDGSLESDLLVAGLSLLPLALLFAAGAILGLGNIEVVGIVAVFALCYTVLILFACLTQVSAVRLAVAAPAVPIIILLTLWLAKIVFAALL
jgi:hypothetical protein